MTSSIWLQIQNFSRLDLTVKGPALLTSAGFFVFIHIDIGDFKNDFYL